MHVKHIEDLVAGLLTASAVIIAAIFLAHHGLIR